MNEGSIQYSNKMKVENKIKNKRNNFLISKINDKKYKEYILTTVNSGNIVRKKLYIPD